MKKLSLTTFLPAFACVTAGSGAKKTLNDTNKN